MVKDKLVRLKRESALLEKTLEIESTKNDDAKVALIELLPIFEKVKMMENYEVIGRIRLDYLFTEGFLANNSELSDCYSRFANLLEGLEA
jgi:hypothetical protein